MRTNVRVNPRRNRTHEGAPAHSNLTSLQMLRRSVLSCMLFEREFYEEGEAIAHRITLLAEEVDPGDLAALAIEARHEYHLRHVPLLLLEVLTRSGAGRPDGLVRQTIERVISRADELAEFLAIYWAKGKHPLSGQTKKGLQAAFRKFDAYQLGKYNRDMEIRLRDVLFLTHPKPTPDMEATFRALADKELAAPDTWEVALSGGADKKETFERLLQRGKLGYMALLRNLRNMMQAGVDEELIRSHLLIGDTSRVLPFRFVAAARACPQLERAIDEALISKIRMSQPLPGRTLVLIDVSRSMEWKLSEKSDLTRLDAASTLAAVLPGDVRMFSFSARGVAYHGDRPKFSNVLVEVPPRLGMAGIDAIINSQEHGGTELGRAVKEANAIPHDRLIVITDEQSSDPVPDPVASKAYMINVASNKNGVGYGRWTHIDGFSERVINYILELEGSELGGPLA